MWKKASTALLILLILTVVFSSGCIQQITKFFQGKGAQCSEFEEEMKKREGIACRCFPTDFVPKEFKNRTGIEGKCFCICQTEEGNVTNVSIARTEEGDYIVSRLTS